MRARGRLSVEETEDYSAALRIAKEQGFSSVREAYLAAAGAARNHFADVSKMVDGKPASVLEAARAYYEEKERAGRSVHTLHDIRVRVFRFARSVESVGFRGITREHIEAFCLAGEAYFELSPQSFMGKKGARHKPRPS